MDALELVAKLKMDISDYEKGLDDAKSEAEGFGGKVLGGLGKVGMAVGKATMVAVGAAASGVAAITKMAVDNFAEYEQLKGGTELMFGEASDYIMNKSKEAYKNVQMSQNDYLTQVNGFAVGLRESLGGNEQAAAELADKIVTAEADIVAATGNTQESVQNAFNGIMKGNYTMVDNLGLGIKPTKEGYQEMIDKVNEWNAAQGHATDYQMDNLADMEAALVDYVEMQGMAGYASDEGAKTIQGSLSTLQGAWSNFLTGLADSEADMAERTTALVDSAVGFAKNVTPVIFKVLENVGPAIEQLVTAFMDQVPELINNTIPKLIESGASIIKSILQGISDNKDTIIDGAFQIMDTLVNSIGELLPMILEVGMQVIAGVATGLAEALPELIPTVIEILLSIINTIIENLPLILDAGLQLIMALVEGIIAAIPQIIAALPSIIAAITGFLINAIPQIITTGITLLTALVEALPTIITAICNALPAIIIAICDTFASNSGSIAQAGVTLITSLIENAPTITTTILTIVPTIITSLIQAFVAAGPQMVEAGKNLMRGLGNGLSSMVGELSSKVKGIGSTIVSAAKSALGIHSPSTVFAEIGENTMLGYEEGVEQEALNARQAIEKNLDFSDMETNINANLTTGVTTSGGGSVAGSNGTAGGASFGKGDTFIIPVYIGQTLFAEAVVDGQTLENYRSGGR